MTRIFKSYEEFLERENKKENGVSQEFANINTSWEAKDASNEGCWNCSRCSGCFDCFDKNLE